MVTRLSTVLLAGLSLALIACERDDTNLSPTGDSLAYLVDADEAEIVGALAFDTQAEHAEARAPFAAERRHRFAGDCFALVYPVTLAFADGATALATDSTDLRELVGAWAAETPNPNRRNRPRLSFPVTIQLADGGVEEVASRRELRGYIRACRPDVEPCASLVFPLSADIGGEEIELGDAAALRAALRAYRSANPDGERASFAYPLDVELATGELVSVASREELRQTLQACRRERRADLRGCFSYNFPVTLTAPNGDTLTVARPQGLRRAFSHARAGGRARLVYPLAVTLAGGEVVTVADRRAFAELRRGCR